MALLAFGCTQKSTDQNQTDQNQPIGDENMSGNEVAESGDTVEVDYTGKLTTGEQFDSSIGRAPLRFTIDDGRMIAGFNEGVKGMKVGETKKLTLAPKDAYGEIDPSMIFEVDKNKFSGSVQVGMQVQAGGAGGAAGVGRIEEIKGDKVLVNFNHELAGKTLIFDITLRKLEK